MTSDGRVLYFSTALPLRESGVPHQGRIYRWDAVRGIEVVAERVKQPGVFLSNYYHLSAPSIAASEEVIAFNGRRDCRVGTFCVVTPQTQGVVERVTGGDPLLQQEGFVFLNANGRYALLTGFLMGEVFRIDLASGQQVEMPRSPFQAAIGQRIASDGSYVAPSSTPRGLIHQTGVSLRTIPVSAEPWTVALSANGATAVYESRPEASVVRRIYSVEMATGRETLLLTSEAAGRGPANMSISSDGRRILIVASEAADRPTQWLFLIDSDGSRPDWQTYIDEGFREAVLSGDGRFVFAVSNNNRVFRIDAVSGAATEIIKGSPFVATLAGAPLAGSSIRLQGGGFTWSECRAESDLLPESLCGVEVEFVGRRMPIERVAAGEIRFQIPWDAAVPPPVVDRFELVPEDAITVHHWEKGLFGAPVHWRPRVVYQPQLEPDGVRHFDGLPITPANGARAGETVKVYATGLGPVDPPARNGQRAVEGVHRVSSPIDCSIGPNGDPVELLSATLAAGQVGVYELSVRLPAVFPGSTSVVGLGCRIHDDTGPTPRLLQASIWLDTPRR